MEVETTNYGGEMYRLFCGLSGEILHNNLCATLAHNLAQLLHRCFAYVAYALEVFEECVSALVADAIYLAYLAYLARYECLATLLAVEGDTKAVRLIAYVAYNL